MNDAVLASIGFLGVVVASLVDGRRAVPLAALSLSIALVPTVVPAQGSGAALLLLGVAVLTWLMGEVAYRVARSHFSWAAGLDPLVPVAFSRAELFGPRSIRVASTVVSIPVASWAHFHVALGGLATTTGFLFPLFYAWVCTGFRFLTARTLEDVAVATTMIAVASASGWMVHGGGHAFIGAGGVMMVSPLSATIVGWLAGRHQWRTREDG